MRTKGKYSKIIAQYMVIGMLVAVALNVFADGSILLARNKRATISIQVTMPGNISQQFAADELARYLKLISGATFKITNDHILRSRIRLSVDHQKSTEDYSIKSNGPVIELSGGSDRAVLYAVYDLLSRLGCRWIAPDFSFYKGGAEYIPKKNVLYYDGSKPVVAHPSFTYRKLDVEEGQTHTVENLRQMIDWMPKLRFNVLMVPLDYQGTGRVKWDNWRDALIPELKKRDLLTEVGGHGYQNFLNAGMERGMLFKLHPEWFGENKNCQPDPAPYMVFNIENTGALHYLVNQVVRYLRERPEINIFDFWPPDGAHWADCADWLSKGTPQERQASLLNALDSALRKQGLHVKLEIIAYDKTILPPQSVALNNRVLVDICPINQNFETQIYDHVAKANEDYVEAINSWRQQFGGDIGLYTYFRKYAWKSLPNVMPHYIQHDMQWYARIPVQGITTYAEPGDWYTYELNHFVFGQLAWNVQANVDSLTNIYCSTRYGVAAKTIAGTYADLEQLVRKFGSIRNSSLKPAGDIKAAIKKLRDDSTTINNMRMNAPLSLSANFSRLLLMLQYAMMDMQIRAGISEEKPQEDISHKVQGLINFLNKNVHNGTFLLSAQDNVKSFMRYNYRKR